MSLYSEALRLISFMLALKRDAIIQYNVVTHYINTRI